MLELKKVKKFIDKYTKREIRNTTDCLECGVKKGENCKTSGGGKYRSVHNKRIEDYFHNQKLVNIALQNQKSIKQNDAKTQLDRISHNMENIIEILFKTSDGKLHNTETEANDHINNKKISELIGNVIKDDFFPNMIKSEVIEMIIKNRCELISLLKQIK